MSVDRIVLALDGMGGDHAPRVVVDGADIARERYPGTVSYTHLTLPTKA